MKKRIIYLVTGMVICIGVLPLITTAYGAAVTIGADSTDIGRILFVTPKPGDTAAANGTALLNALDGITGDANNPYLIKLGPGIYSLGSGHLVMKPYVSIEGSGEKATKITAAVSFF